MDYVNRSRGLLFMLAGMLLLVPDALMIRLSAMDEMNLIFWRSALAVPVFIMILGIISIRNRSFAWFSFNRSFFLLILCFSGTAVLYSVSINMTKVANALVLLSLSPVFTALIDWIFHEEKLPLRTWIAIATCLFGVLVLVGGGIGGGSLVGDALALFTAILLGLQFSLMGRCRSETVLPALAIGYSLPALLAAPFVSSFLLSTVTASIPAALFMGVLSMPFSFVLISKGTSFLPPPQAALFMLLETVCGPLLVWFFLGENPGPYALIGGTIVIGGLAWHSGVDLMADRRQRRRKAAFIGVKG